MKQLLGRLFFGKGIRHRLLISFSIFIVLAVLMAGLGAWRLLELDRMTANMSTAASANLRIQRLVAAWNAETESNAVRAAVLSRSDDPDVMKVLAAQFAATARQVSVSQKEAEGLVTGPRAGALLADVGARRNAFLEARSAVLDKKNGGQANEALALLDASLLPAANAYLAAARSLGEHYAARPRKEAAEAAANAERGRDLLAGAALAILLFGIAFTLWITSTISRPLRRAAAVARQVADGDLSVKLDAREISETGHLLQALAHMTEELQSLLAEVSAGARAVSDSSAQIAQGNVDLSQRTQEQASTLEETASTMEELTSTVAQNAESARKASQLAMGASKVAHKGSEVVEQVLGIMDGIEDASKKITNIIGVIDGIAFQTNILALNAAVEAARAGEQGRGFAVVAAEVRTLAHRSAAAAKEIKSLISDSVQKVQAGASLANDAGHTMVEVVASFKQVSDLIAEIAAASREQSSGIEQVNTAVTMMEQAVQQDASLVEQATAATESMHDQATSLLQMVSRFKLRDDDGEHGSPHADMPVSAVRWTGNGAARTPAADRLRERAAPAAATRQLGQLRLDSNS